MLNIGIAGFGKMGRIRALEIEKNLNTELIAIFDPKIPEDHNKNIKICTSYDEFLQEDLDAVFICTYNNVNAEYTKKALMSGRHVFCEKPPAMNSVELQSVIEEERKSNIVLKYGFNHRLHYSVMEAKKLIVSDTLGKLLWIRGVYGKAGGIEYQKNWRSHNEISGGGILIDQGIHMLDLMMYFSEQIFTQIQSVLTSSYWNSESEDNAFITMKSKSGVIATFHSSATQWRHKFLLEMYFEKGYIELDGILSNSGSYAPETMTVGEREFEDSTFAMGKPKENKTWFAHDDSWALELQDFIGAIENNSKVTHGTSQDAYNALKLVETIYEKSGFYDNKPSIK